jgi:hypothetical protein
MTPKDKAINLVDRYRNILMNEDTECGNEILCSVIAKESALIAVNVVLNLCWGNNQVGINHWNEVKHEIEKL